MTPSPLALLLDELVRHPDAGPAAETLHGLRQDLDRPVRVGVVGRVSSGKSTLVNALIGRRCAPTDAQDCTRLVTVYSFGAPEGVCLLSPDGSVTALPPDYEEHVFESTEGVVQVTLQCAPLQGLTIVDTPGLAGTEQDAGPAVRAALAQVDVLIYLFRGALRADDAQLVGEFVAAGGSTGPLGARAIGVLAHADNAGGGGWGDADPIDTARAQAAELAGRLAGSFLGVVAVSGLLAESARTGGITEAHARALRALASVPVDEIQLAALGALPRAGGVEGADLLAPASALGPYGLTRGRAQAASASELAAWAADRSGVVDLERLLKRRALPLARVEREERVFSELVTRSLEPGCPPALRARVEQAVHGPEGRSFRELRALRLLVADAPASPLRDDLERLLVAGTSGRRRDAMGFSTGGRDALLARANRYQALAGTARQGAVAQAARTLADSLLQLALTSIEPGRP